MWGHRSDLSGFEGTFRSYERRRRGTTLHVLAGRAGLAVALRVLEPRAIGSIADIVLVEGEIGRAEREHVVEERVRDVPAGNQHLRRSGVRVGLAPAGRLERFAVEVGAAELVVVDGIDVFAVVLRGREEEEKNVPGRNCRARSIR